MLSKGINFNSGLNIYSSLPSYSATATAYKGAKIVMIWQNDKRVLGIFSLRMRTNGFRKLLGPDLQRIVSATYELFMISGTYDKLRQQQIGAFRKSYIITENQNKVFDAKLPYWLSLSAI